MANELVATRDATQKPQEKGLVARTPAEQIKHILEDKLPAIREVQTKYITAERAVKLACMAVNGDAKLQKCSPLTILQSVVTSVQLGLELGGPLQHCWLVPYGATCQLLVGYRGLVNLARRSREIAMIEARLVYAGERFEVTYGTHPGIVHVPDFGSERLDKDIVAAYAVATLGNGHRQFEVMSRPEILKIANKNGGNVWDSSFGEMCRKTPTRRLCKYLPMTNEMALALGEEDDFVKPGPSPELITIRARTAALDGPRLNGNGSGHHAAPLVPTRESAPEPDTDAPGPSGEESQVTDGTDAEAPQAKPKKKPRGTGDASSEPPEDLKLGEGAPLV